MKQSRSKLGLSEAATAAAVAARKTSNKTGTNRFDSSNQITLESRDIHL